MGQTGETTGVGLEYVVTVCGHAHETCPVFPAGAKVVHVGFDDPPKLDLGQPLSAGCAPIAGGGWSDAETVGTQSEGIPYDSVGPYRLLRLIGEGSKVWGSLPTR